MDKLELADKVEALTEPCRAIDWEINCRNGLSGVGMYGSHPRYTASIDAAMTLKPNNMRMSVQQRRSYEGIWVGLYRDASTEVSSGKSMEFCRAYLAAALRAEYGGGASNPPD
jgi:hypothetical protein